MRFIPFAKRNFKELIRDPLSIVLGLAMPIFLLILFVIINKNVDWPLDIFTVQKLTPGLIVFGYSFLTMFGAILMNKDKNTAFYIKLKASPLTSKDFIFGYSIPMLPIAIIQSVVIILVAFIFGLGFDFNLFLAIIIAIPSAMTAISLGLIMGTFFNDRQISGVGTMYITLSSILGGAWMELSSMGSFSTIAYILPWANSIDAVRACFVGNYAGMFPYLYISIAYAIGLTVLAVLLYFVKNKKS